MEEKVVEGEIARIHKTLLGIKINIRGSLGGLRTFWNEKKLRRLDQMQTKIWFWLIWNANIQVQYLGFALFIP